MKHDPDHNLSDPEKLRLQVATLAEMRQAS